MKKFLSIYILSLIAISNVMAADEVKYTMVSKSELYEIRKYSDRLVIETETSNQNSGFRKLFKYISGDNKDKKEIKMTTPVTQTEKNGNMTIWSNKREKCRFSWKKSLRSYTGHTKVVKNKKIYII